MLSNWPTFAKKKAFLKFILFECSPSALVKPYSGGGICGPNKKDYERAA